MNIKENLATNLVKYRKALNITQAELAEKLNYSDKAISKWERGESIPDVTVLHEIAKFYGTTIDKLISTPTERINVKNLISNKKRSILCLLATCFVWLVALILYCLPNIMETRLSHTWMTFIYAIPITFFILCIMFSVWKKSLCNLIILSLLIWTVILAIYLSLIVFGAKVSSNLWFVFLIGIPLQLLVLLWYGYKKVK